MHFRTAISKINFKIAPCKNPFQNCYLSNIVIEEAKTKLAIFFKCVLKKIKKKRKMSMH